MNLPSFHDSNLIGLSWGSRELTLHMRTASNVDTTVRIHGITNLRIDGLREGNIIDQVHLYMADECVISNRPALEWVQFLLFGPNTEQATLSAVELTSVQNLFQECASHGNQLFVLSQVYGCELACICESVET